MDALLPVANRKISLSELLTPSIEKVRNYALIRPAFVENSGLFSNHLTVIVF